MIKWIVCCFCIALTTSAMERNAISLYGMDPMFLIVMQVFERYKTTYTTLQTSKKNFYNLVRVCRQFRTLLYEKPISTCVISDAGQNIQPMSIRDWLLLCNNTNKETNATFLEYTQNKKLKNIAPEYEKFTAMTYLLYNCMPHKEHTLSEAELTIMLIQLAYEFADFSRRDGNGNAPLYYAIRNSNCNIDLFKRLIEEFQADTTKIDNQDRNALSVAQEFAQEVINDNTQYAIVQEKIDILEKYATR